MMCEGLCALLVKFSIEIKMKGFLEFMMCFAFNSHQKRNAFVNKNENKRQLFLL